MKAKKTSNILKIPNSLILGAVLETIIKEELKKNESKMQLAIKIGNAIEASGFKKYEFAKKIRNNSEINKWLSGTHNFTVETLLFLQNQLEIKLFDLEINQKS